MIRTLLASIVCLALGLAGGFYLGRQTAPVAAVVVPTPAPAPSASNQPAPDTGSRARTSEPTMPTPPDVTPPAGQVPAVQPPPNPATQALNAPAANIALPIDNLKLTDIQDTFEQTRGGGTRKHEATDIMAPRGTPVRAVTDGTIKKLFVSKAGGNTIYQFDPSSTYCYYYAHLDRYAQGIHEGMQVKRGDLIGYVGSTGDADPNGPHLHFAIFELGPQKNWWQGTPINPYQTLVQAWHQRQGQ